MSADVFVMETHSRDVRISLWPDEVPVHTTPAGKSPIRPRYVHIHYSIDGGYAHVVLRGPRVTDRPRPAYHRGAWPLEVKRRITTAQLAVQPQWLLDLVMQHAPEPGRCVAFGSSS